MIYNLKKDSEDSRDYKYSLHLGVDLTQLPKSVDLRQFMPPIFDQGQLGSCTSNMSAGHMGYYNVLYGQQYEPFSRLQHYWHERTIENSVNDDSGAQMRTAFQVMTEIGMGYEKDWTYDISKFRDKPSDAAEAEAPKHKLDEYHRIENLDALKHALSSGLTVGIGIMVYQSFESQDVARTGVVPMPNKGSEQCLGGHAVLVVGYDDDKNHLIVRNSWGEGWGDKGYFYLPYDFINDSSLVLDCWTGFKKKE